MNKKESISNCPYCSGHGCDACGYVGDENFKPESGDNKKLTEKPKEDKA